MKITFGKAIIVLLNLGKIMTQGYQLIAIGPERYKDLAVTCAASIRYWDKKRPIQVVTDSFQLKEGPHSYLFDYFTIVDPTKLYAGPLVKLMMYEFAIYDETMFMDVDCLIIKNDIDKHWVTLSNDYDVSTPGQCVSSGDWYIPIQDICSMFAIDHIVKMNSGAFFLKKKGVVENFFNIARGIFANYGNFMRCIHNDLGPPDEPYLAIAFAKAGIKPYPEYPDDGNNWMLSTIDSQNIKFSEDRRTITYHKRGHDVSPSICHFCALQPNEIYNELSETFRQGVLQA